MNAIAKFPAYPSTKGIQNGFLDAFFNRNIANFIGNDVLAFAPAVNVLESKDDFKLEIAAPGFEKENFSLQIKENQLVIRGEKMVSSENTENERYTRREFSFENFERAFNLPETVNQNDIAAVYNNGVLLVTLPKKEEAKPLVKSIEIL